MGSNSNSLAPWEQGQQGVQPPQLAPWEQKQQVPQVQLPPGSSQDQDPQTRFLNSLGSSVSVPIKVMADALTVHSRQEKQAQVAHAMDLAQRMEAGDQSAKNEMISSLPGGSTYLKIRNGDYAGALGDIAGMGVLGGIAKGAGPTLESDLAQAAGAGIKAGVGDVAAGTAKVAGGGTLAAGARALGGGPFIEYIVAKPLVKSGLKQVGKGIKSGASAAKEAYSSESPVDTSEVPIDYKSSMNPDIAKNLTVGSRRTMPDGSIEELKSIPIDDISGDPGNRIDPGVVKEYQRNGYTVQPQLRQGSETKFTINEGHHRILSDVRNGKTNITAWVPVGQ